MLPFAVSGGVATKHSQTPGELEIIVSQIHALKHRPLKQQFSQLADPAFIVTVTFVLRTKFN